MELKAGSHAAVKGGEREAKQAGLPYGPGRWSWAGWEGKKNGGGGKSGPAGLKTFSLFFFKTKQTDSIQIQTQRFEFKLNFKH